MGQRGGFGNGPMLVRPMPLAGRFRVVHHQGLLRQMLQLGVVVRLHACITREQKALSDSFSSGVTASGIRLPRPSGNRENTWRFDKTEQGKSIDQGPRRSPFGWPRFCDPHHGFSRRGRDCVLLPGGGTRWPGAAASGGHREDVGGLPWPIRTRFPRDARSSIQPTG